MTGPDDLSALREQPFSAAIVKFEKLLAQGGPAFLLGAGCSKCAGLPLTAELTQEVFTSNALDDTTKAILAAICDLFEGSSDANIEDYLSELVDLLAIVDRRASRGATQNGTPLGGKSFGKDQLQLAIEQIKRGIASVIERKVSVEIHQRFVRAVHRPLRPGKSSAAQTVDYLVLNYDTVIEDALALERIPFADGLDGGVTGWWSPTMFDRNGLAARVLKLHGSINWCELPEDPLPRRVGPSLRFAAATTQRLLIWPASTKYRETQLDPFAQLTERARRGLRPDRASQRVLVVCGYRFGDAHINLELDRALREPAGNLTVAVFTSTNEPSGQLKDWHEDANVSEKVLVFANRGFFHGTDSTPASQDLPWWKFENITRLLEGER